MKIVQVKAIEINRMLMINKTAMKKNMPMKFGKIKALLTYKNRKIL